MCKWTLTEVWSGQFLVVAHWYMPGTPAPADGEPWPGFACFAGSRRRCKVWIKRLDTRLRKEAAHG